MMHNMDGSNFWEWSHGIGMIFWWIVIIAIVVIVITFLTKSGIFTKSENESALDIAKKRYAKGEISKDEFEELKKKLI